MFAAWFTFGDVTASGQRWLTTQGGFEGAVAEIVVFETTGGRFDDPQVVDTVPIGTMKIDFSDCNNATLDYSLNDGGLEGEISIIQALPKQISLCQNLTNAP